MNNQEISYCIEMLKDCATSKSKYADEAWSVISLLTNKIKVINNNWEESKINPYQPDVTERMK